MKDSGSVPPPCETEDDCMSQTTQKTLFTIYTLHSPGKKGIPGYNKLIHPGPGHGIDPDDTMYTQVSDHG